MSIAKRSTIAEPSSLPRGGNLDFGALTGLGARDFSASIAPTLQSIPVVMASLPLCWQALVL